MSFRKSALISSLVAFSLAVVAAPAAMAALKTGAQAMDFTTQAALAGKPFSFTLNEALKDGPVVLYFYPKAFTSGCTIEANQFAEATPEFNRMGATVIGISADNIETLQKFSVEECRNKFAVAVGSKKVIKAYDANLPIIGRIEPHHLCHRARRQDHVEPCLAQRQRSCPRRARRGENMDRRNGRPIAIGAAPPRRPYLSSTAR